MRISVYTRGNLSDYRRVPQRHRREKTSPHFCQRRKPSLSNLSYTSSRPASFCNALFRLPTHEGERLEKSKNALSCDSYFEMTQHHNAAVADRVRPREVQFRGYSGGACVRDDASTHVPSRTRRYSSRASAIKFTIFIHSRECTSSA